MIKSLPCLDSIEASTARKRELDIPPETAAALGKSAAEAAESGHYLDEAGRQVDWRDEVEAACAAKVSIPPSAPLPAHESASFPETRVQIANETTLAASRRLADLGWKPLALNFANGVVPGGGFLGGARAQEEVLCRLMFPSFERMTERRCSNPGS